MGKEHVLEKLRELIALGAEEIVQEEAAILNTSTKFASDQALKVGINLGDDVGGAWTNGFTTRFSSKFELNALIQRGFCTPYFWTSETFEEKMVRSRIRSYMFRSLYALAHQKPNTLADYLHMESYVQASSGETYETLSQEELELIRLHLEEHRESESYNLIFNFFFGDEACESLAYPTYGMPEMAGFRFASIRDEDLS